jgi:hypothetical protein
LDSNVGGVSGSNLKYWLLGFLIFFWKFSSLKNRKINKGTVPLNMFVYPTSLQEFREHRKRLENQRRLHDKDFFSKRETSYLDQSNRSSNTEFGNYQNTYGRQEGMDFTNYNLDYETDNYSQNLYNQTSTF